ncbi:hypothetical protein DMP11_04385 [Parvibacter caecicola]|nr:hypothetical protein DMP11_04385 [Parvibacter caecicola]
MRAGVCGVCGVRECGHAACGRRAACGRVRRTACGMRVRRAGACGRGLRTACGHGRWLPLMAIGCLNRRPPCATIGAGLIPFRETNAAGQGFRPVPEVMIRPLLILSL